MSAADFQRHVILYAKFHYITGWSTLKDIETIAERTDIPATWDNIIDELSHIAITAIREASNPVSPLTEYREQMKFLFTNKETLEKYGPSPLDRDAQFKIKLEQMYKETIVISMLVVIARWMTTLDLGKADPKILNVRSPEKETK
jgi:hypothetical protein